jgi:hypothetical protein
MDRATVLGKLSAGQLSVDEAIRLLNAEPEGSPADVAADPASGLRGSRLRVRVSNLETGSDRVNVNLPMTLVEAGLKLGARYEAEIADLNVNEILDAARGGAGGKLVDVENWERGERVEVFIE